VLANQEEAMEKGKGKILWVERKPLKKGKSCVTKSTKVFLL